MKQLTKDGAIVTSVEQHGEFSGEEVGRVWISGPDGNGSTWTYFGLGSVPTTYNVVQQAPEFTSDELIAKLEGNNSRPVRKKAMRCPKCKQTGYAGEYPFSTCPPLCDDCN